MNNYQYYNYQKVYIADRMAEMWGLPYSLLRRFVDTWQEAEIVSKYKELVLT